MALLSKDDAVALFQKVSSFSSGGDLQLSLEGGVVSTLKFARNEVVDYTRSEELFINITLLKNGKSVQVAGRGTDDNSLKNLVNQAEQLVGQSGSTSAPVFFSDKQITETPTWSGNTATLTHDRRVAIVAEVISVCSARKMTAAGSLEDRQCFNAVLNTKDIVYYQKSTYARLALNVRTLQSQGSASVSAAHFDISQIKPDRLADIASQKAQSTTNPRTPETGKFPVILEAGATGDLMLAFFKHFRKMTGKQPLDIRDIIGQVSLHDSITVISDPTDKSFPFVPFTQNGRKLTKTTWIDKGKVLQLPEVELPVSMSGSSQSVDDLMKGTENGILISRLHDLKPLDNEGAVFTAVTRDGTWLIENGKVKYPIKNMRFQVIIVDFFKNLTALGKSEAIDQNIFPSVKGDGFYFTAVTDSY